MIFPLGGLIIGGVLGAVMAARRGGRVLDMAQWAAVMAIILGLVGLTVMVILDRALS